LQWNCPAGETNDLAQINNIIENLNKTAINLKNLTAQIEYTHAQPLFETQTVRTGKLFYAKDVNNSALRINFLTIKQDESNEQSYKEDYIFDGWKMTKIDYQSKSAITEQLAKEKPIEPLELVQSFFPIIGFAKPDELTGQFDIKLQQKTGKQNFDALLLIPKENSGFFKTYKQVEIKIDSEKFLPFDFSAVTIEDEKMTIKLTQIDKITSVKKDIFDIVIPADFVRTQK
jgi:outer membrane lipoprotein-sorting protein